MKITGTSFKELDRFGEILVLWARYLYLKAIVRETFIQYFGIAPWVQAEYFLDRKKGGSRPFLFRSFSCTNQTVLPRLIMSWQGFEGLLVNQ